MKRITFWLDVISPYAYLAFERLPIALQGLSYAVDYKPVLLAGLLSHHGQLGPAEIAPKRDWTYRQVQWLAREHGIALHLPAHHPFNPLGLLRLALACERSADRDDEPSGLANRYVCEAVFRHAWQGGADAADPARLRALVQALEPELDPSSQAVKARLKANTEEAIGRGLFGVPAFTVGDRQFWGLDALPMLRACLEADPWFETPAWTAVQQVGAGVKRR